jgi:hypothetical protein
MQDGHLCRASELHAYLIDNQQIQRSVVIQLSSVVSALWRQVLFTARVRRITSVSSTLARWLRMMFFARETAR